MRTKGFFQGRTKKQIAIFFVIAIYLVLSVGYIGYDLWNNFTQNVVVAAFNQGKSATIQELITAAENEKCEAFPVNMGQKQIKLINVACLNKAETPTKQ